MASDTRTCWDPEDSDEDIYVSMTQKAAVPLHTPAPLPISTMEKSTEALMATPSDANPTTRSASELLCLEVGEVSEKGISFVPWKLVQGYPRMFSSKKNSEQILKVFDQNLLNGRDWDLFAQCDAQTSKTGNSPLLLVPATQFEEYLSSIDAYLDEKLGAPEGLPRALLNLTFGEWDTPRPYFLGRADSANRIDELRKLSWTLPSTDISRLTPSCYQMYCDKMAEIYTSLNFAKVQKKREQARKKMIVRNKEYGRVLKRVQRYLGLRRAMSHVSPNSSLEHSKWNVSKPAPYKARDSVRFVCVDIEAYERDTRTITEIGLAVLDTEDLIETPPGENGKDWFSLIQPYHLRIHENRFIVNSKYVKGCPEAFNFGKSQIVPLKDIREVVDNIISGGDPEDQRPIVIVGHDIRMDLKFLLRIGYNPWSVPSIIDEIDTSHMLQRIERATNSRGLEAMCATVGIDGKNYHNGGNDAVYTLQAMIAMAVKWTVGGFDEEEDLFTPGTNEWTDGEMDDGGCAKRSVPPAEAVCTTKSEDGPREVQW
ncbi:hypothetical protein F5Y08DRAFT_352955 [Xylaria arbuscula]|nr:hypothetical protein F5Y08DRAFT_352955 [Xylaria arbuscula]